MTKQKETFFKMQASTENKTADVFILGEITSYAFEDFGEHSAATFKSALDGLGDVDVINLHINSPGGSVFEGVAIHNMLKQHKARVVVHVDALAASIASVIAMAGDEIRMPSNSMLMIHNAWTWASGNANDLRKAADDIERINESVIQSYLDKAGQQLDRDTLKALLDNETWLSAEEAFSYGLATHVESAVEAVACVDTSLIKQFKQVPKQFLQDDTQANTLSEEERKSLLAEAQASNELLKNYLI